MPIIIMSKMTACIASGPAPDFDQLRFNGHFPGGPGVSQYQNVSILDFIWAKNDGVGDNNRSSSQIITANEPTPSILWSRYSSCHPTVSKH